MTDPYSFSLPLVYSSSTRHLLVHRRNEIFLSSQTSIPTEERKAMTATVAKDSFILLVTSDGRTSRVPREKDPHATCTRYIGKCSELIGLSGNSKLAAYCDYTREDIPRNKVASSVLHFLGFGPEGVDYQRDAYGTTIIVASGGFGLSDTQLEALTLLFSVAKQRPNVPMINNIDALGFEKMAILWR